MMRNESARHRASDRAGERRVIRRQYLLRLTPPRAGWADTNRQKKPLFPARAQHRPSATEIPSTLAVQTLSPTPANHFLPACRGASAVDATAAAGRLSLSQSGDPRRSVSRIGIPS
jgi:hypothetical protein